MGTSTSYGQALRILQDVVLKNGFEFGNYAEDLPLISAVGRISVCTYVSPRSTPGFDSSAMDGFAIRSAGTDHASSETPAIFQVSAVAAAGHVPTNLSAATSEVRQYHEPCAQIMTGARVPELELNGDRFSFDSIVKVEDVCTFDLMTNNGPVPCIKVWRPVAKNTNKRWAGNDLAKGDIVVRAHEVIRPQHVMVMASLGIRHVQVLRKLRVGIWSTGDELHSETAVVSADSKIMDANGPYLVAALTEHGVEAEFLGVLTDDATLFQQALLRATHAGTFDVLISSGAVSKGEFDFVPVALQGIADEVHFHGVAIRPGHPVLFATVPSNLHRHVECDAREPTRSTSQSHPAAVAYFGLPGNPVATAASFRFLVLPFLRYLHRRPPEVAIRARLKLKHEIGIPSSSCEHGQRSKIWHIDQFRHGIVQRTGQDEWMVELSRDQSPAKLQPLLHANCWCHIPGLMSLKDGILVDCFPL